VEEGDVREGGGDLGGLVHVAERGGEDDLVAVLRQLADDALGVGALGHVLDELGDHLALHRRFHLLAALIVLEGPAGVPDRADVDEADLGGRLGGERGGGQQGGSSQGREHDSPVVHGVFLQ